MRRKERHHPFLPNLDDAMVSRMLSKVGASSVEDLFSDIPKRLRLGRPLRVPEAESEYAVRREVSSKLASGRAPGSLCFLGGGVWPHYIPAAVDSIASRQEFYTSYTPYQAEVSQGMLQALFEYQSLMCDLLGMDACNSSLYDWASGVGEAVRMAGRVTGRRKALFALSTGPARLRVARTYAEPMGMGLETVRYDRSTGTLDLQDLSRKLSQDVACVYIENPNCFGVIEREAEEVFSKAREAGALSVVGVDPISLSVVRGPGEYGADVAVGEGQPLGVPMNFGGPHLGIFAVRDIKLARSMPGRLIGMTTETADAGQKAFAMALQTREQHIRREGATSNICTNQSLLAVTAAAYLSLLGKEGFRALGETVLANSHYAVRRLSRVEGVKVPHFKGAFFKEFVASYGRVRADGVYHRMAKSGVFAGYPLEKSLDVGARAGSYCVTEVHTRGDIERLAEALEEALK